MLPWQTGHTQTNLVRLIMSQHFPTKYSVSAFISNIEAAIDGFSNILFYHRPSVFELPHRKKVVEKFWPEAITINPQFSGL